MGGHHCRTCGGTTRRQWWPYGYACYQCVRIDGYPQT